MKVKNKGIKLNPLASIKRRLLQGYGLIITDWGPVKDPKTPKHWCLSLNFNKNNIIKPSKQNNLDKKTESSFEDKLKKLRKVHRNAYHPWTSQE